MAKYGYYELANGVKLPKVGYGTWQIPNGDVCVSGCRAALDAGYSHIDTAAAYGNERSVGKAVRESGIARSDIFVTSKLLAEVKGYKATYAEFERTMDALGLDYLDLYLIHAPRPWGDSSGKDYSELNIESWKAMEELYEAGRIRAIGVSNFTPGDIAPLLEKAKITPMVDQISYFIGRRQEKTADFCVPKGIFIEAYSPMATGNLLKNETLLSAAKKLGVTLPQLCIRYCLQRGTAPLPRSKSPEHILSNYDLDFTIPGEVMAQLNKIEY